MVEVFSIWKKYRKVKDNDLNLEKIDIENEPIEPEPSDFTL